MRFYSVTWRERGQPIAIDLSTAPSGTRGALVGSLAAAAKAFGRSVQTDLAASPAPAALVRPIGDYLWSDGSFNAARAHRHLADLRDGRAPHAFTLRTGVPAEGADLVGRDAALNAARERLDRGESVHLMAPRRYGKTSLLRRLCADVRVNGGVVVFIDGENLTTVASFAVSVAEQAIRAGILAVRALPELRGWPAEDASGVARGRAKEELLGQLGAGAPRFLAELLNVLRDARAVLCVDEFSRFLLSAHEADRTLPRGAEVLRAARADGVRTVVAGSSGLRAFLAKAALPFEDLVPVTLDPLARDTAAVLVEELLYGHGRAPTPAVVSAVLDHVGAAVPYFLQALVHHTLAEAGLVVDLAAVDRAYRLRLLDLEGSEFFRPFRLKERNYPDAWRRPAARMLGLLARSESVAMADLLALAPDAGGALFAALAEDYDIVETDGVASLRSKVLRERWALREAWLTGG